MIFLIIWKASDTDETIGGTKVIQNGWISPRQICLTIIGLLLSTVLIGWWLIGHSGQEWLWGPVVFAVLSAVFYVAPPIRYGCRGYGELFVCLNMGFIMVMGSYAVMANGFSAQSLALALPVGLMVAGILYYQSLPEIETDLAAGKRTLANILGKAKAELVFKLWWPAVWVLMANLWACGLVGWPVFLGLLTFPLYWRACRLIHEAVEWLESRPARAPCAQAVSHQRRAADRRGCVEVKTRLGRGGGRFLKKAPSSPNPTPPPAKTFDLIESLLLGVTML